MPRRRKLVLRRDVLSELGTEELRHIVGGDRPTETCYSCLTYVSCNILDCVATIRRCIDQ